jgi:hypothetical protein
MLQDICADHIVELAVYRRETLIEIGFDELYGTGEMVCVPLGALDPDDFETALGQQFADIAVAAAKIEDTLAAPVGGQALRHKEVATVPAGFEGVNDHGN